MHTVWHGGGVGGVGGGGKTGPESTAKP